MERRYDIDWLRVIAIGLLLIYHVAIGFQPWGVFIGFIQSDEPLEWIWAPMSMLNVWRIPLLFFISGMGVCFAMNRRGWKQLLLERTKRILVPFIFGVLVIVPVHIYLWQNYYSQDLVYNPAPAHLWFLGNIFIYVMVLAPLFYYLKNNKDSFIAKKLINAFSHPVGLIVIMLFFILESMVLAPEPYELYAMTLHGFVLGFLAFLFGFLLVFSGGKIWGNLKKLKWALLILASLFFALRLLIFQLEVPYFYYSVETCLWVFCVFGFGYTYLNKPGKTLRYLSDGAYPIYIVHMIAIYLGAILIFPLDIPEVAKFLLLVLFTVALSIGLYEIIRRIPFLRPLFGLKLNKRRPVFYIENRSIVKGVKLKFRN